VLSFGKPEGGEAKCSDPRSVEGSAAPMDGDKEGDGDGDDKSETWGAGGYAVPSSLFWVAPDDSNRTDTHVSAAWRCPVETAI